MSRLLSAALFLVLVQASSMKSRATTEENDFMKDCITGSSCGELHIRLPFRLQSRHQYCGAPGLEVSCSSAGEAMLTVPRIGSCKLTSIDYNYAIITVDFGEFWNPCPLQKLISINLTNPIPMYKVDNSWSFNLVSCPEKIATNPSWISGPLSCPRIDGKFVYAASQWESMDKLPSGCSRIGNDGEIPDGGASFGEAVESFIRRPHMSARVTVPEAAACRTECEERGNYCGFNRTTNRTFCIAQQPGGRSNKFATGLSIGGCIALVLVALILLYVIRKSNKDQKIIRPIGSLESLPMPPKPFLSA